MTPGINAFLWFVCFLGYGEIFLWAIYLLFRAKLPSRPTKNHISNSIILLGLAIWATGLLLRH